MRILIVLFIGILLETEIYAQHDYSGNFHQSSSPLEVPLTIKDQQKILVTTAFPIEDSTHVVFNDLCQLFDNYSKNSSFRLSYKLNIAFSDKLKEGTNGVSFNYQEEGYILLKYSTLSGKKNKLKRLFVLAHEMSHHLLGHTLTSYPEILKECYANFYAGILLKRYYNTYLAPVQKSWTWGNLQKDLIKLYHKEEDRSILSMKKRWGLFLLGYRAPYRFCEISNIIENMPQENCLYFTAWTQMSPESLDKLILTSMINYKP